MQFTAKKQNLIGELTLIQGIVEKRSTRPILSNVLLESAEKGVSMYSTDLEVGLNLFFEADVVDGGSITAPAKKLADIVRLLPEGADVSVQVLENNYLQITSGKIEYKLAGAPKADFPSLPRFDFGEGIEIPSQMFKELIARTVYAITTEETRYALNGAQLMLDGSVIRMVTTDAHRLALAEFPFESSSAQALEILIPRKTVVELRTLLSDRLDSVLFGSTDNHIFFRIGDRVLDSRVLEGQFPNYEKVLPSGNDKRIILDRAAFADAIGRVALLSHETSRAVRLAFSPGSLVVSSSNPEMGEAKEEMEAEYSGPELAIGFNSRYLLDFITAASSEQIILEIGDVASAGLMSPGGEIEGVHKYVIMPMRI